MRNAQFMFSFMPYSKTTEMLKCKLLKIHCYISDESDADEAFLKFSEDKIWPIDSKYVGISGGEHVLNIDLPKVKEGTSIEVELWDYDTWSPNDKLGIFKMVVDGRGGPFISDLLKEKGSKAKYSLEWEVY